MARHRELSKRQVCLFPTVRTQEHNAICELEKRHFSRLRSASALTLDSHSSPWNCTQYIPASVCCILLKQLSGLRQHSKSGRPFMFQTFLGWAKDHTAEGCLWFTKVLVWRRLLFKAPAFYPASVFAHPPKACSVYTYLTHRSRRISHPETNEWGSGGGLWLLLPRSTAQLSVTGLGYITPSFLPVPSREESFSFINHAITSFGALKSFPRASC